MEKNNISNSINSINPKKITLVECPRDAIQGIKNFLPTKAKAFYLNQLLKAGFDILDFGSFVSPKAIPQLADTAELIRILDLENTSTMLLVIIGNERGAKEALSHPEIDYLGFPFSISDTFSHRNIGSSILETFERVKGIQELCLGKGKSLVIYISMAFGNPYQDPWHIDLVLEWVEKLQGLGIGIFSLADTTGMATTTTVKNLFEYLIPAYPSFQFGAHFHTKPDAWREKVEAAFNAGCQQFDTALLGYGGCPMAGDDLVGNMPTDRLLQFIKEKGLETQVDLNKIPGLELAFQNLLNS